MKLPTRGQLKRFGFYSLAIGVTFPIALLELYYLHSLSAKDIFLSESFLCLISIPNFFSNQLATAAYLGRMADMTIGNNYDKANKELVGTLLGITLGLIISIMLLGLGVSAPLVTALGSAANIFFIFRYINICAGFGNRLGRYFDNTDQSRPFFEKAFVLTCQGLGFILGAGLFLLASTSAAQIFVNGTSLISFFSGIQGMPTLVSGIIFATSIGAVFGSFADYLAKAIGHFKTPYFKTSPRPNDDSLFGEIHKFKHNQNRHFEYLCSVVGIAAGLVVAPYVINNLSTLGFLPPERFASLFTKGFITLFTCSIYSSPCSRIGRLMDAFNIFYNTPQDGNNASTSHTQSPPAQQRCEQDHSHVSKPLVVDNKPAQVSGLGMFGSQSKPPQSPAPQYAPEPSTLDVCRIM